jgi:methionyl-tRNA formyltransferase
MLRAVFMGTPEFAVPSLSAVAQLTELRAVVAQPDRPRGRERLRVAPPTVAWARQEGIRVLQPERLKEPETLATLKSLQADVFVVVAYGHILPKQLLQAPQLGCVNVHASLLPRYRGAAPIQWAIARGESVTGITLMKMDEGLDTGPILLQKRCPIAQHETGESLSRQLASLGAKTLAEGLPLLAAGGLVPQEQDPSQATLAPRLTREDGKIDFRVTASEIERRIRAFYPWPGAHCQLPGGKRLKLIRAELVSAAGLPGEVVEVSSNGLTVATGADGLRITELQPEGGRRMNLATFLAGHVLPLGTVLQ